MWLARTAHPRQRGYRPGVPELVELTTQLRTAWLTPDGFAAWIHRLRQESDTTSPPAEGRVHCTYRWIVEGDTVSPPSPGATG